MLQEIASAFVLKARWLRAWGSTSLSAPLMLMYFLMLMMNTLLRDTKDTLLVTSQAGVEAIPILKSWVVIPCSFLYFVVYYKLSGILGPRTLFITILSLFNGFYFAFALVLYPRQYALVPSALSAALHEVLPENARPLQHLVENWLLGVFYCVSELYASAVCQFMFWQVANNVVSLDQAKSIYPLVGAMGNMGMVCAGYMLRLFANQRDIVAASAYLRISSETNLEVALAPAGHAAGEHPQGLPAPFDGGSLQPPIDVAPGGLGAAYALMSSLLLPDPVTSQMRPLDEAWQGTLLGISLMLAASTAVIILTYDSLKARKDRLDAAAEHMEPAAWNDPAVQPEQVSGPVEEFEELIKPRSLSFNSNAHDGNGSGHTVKRRTGSGTHEPRAGPLFAASHAAIEQIAISSNQATPSNSSPLSIGHMAVGSTLSASHAQTSESGSVSSGIPATNTKYWVPETGSSAAHGNQSFGQRGPKGKPPKAKVSLIEGLRTLSKSTPLRCAATLVVSYGIAISLVEVSWKGQVKKSLESPNDYSRFMGMFWTLTGLVSMLFMLIGRVVLQRIGYAPAVLFTPASMAIAGTLFFIVSIVQDVSRSGAPEGLRPNDTIAWSAYFGGAAVLFAKSAKYAFFDATKEIIFIPLDEDSKNLGKAAIDVVAYRLSKSGGSFVLQMVIVVFGSVSTTMGILPIALVFGFVVVAWIRAAILASKFINQTGAAQRSGDDLLAGQHVV